MSKNIRSYFTVMKKQTSNTADNDSDVIPESPDVQIKNKKKQSRKKRVIEDSDEEVVSPKKAKLSSKKQPDSQQVQKSPKFKEVTLTDLFGNGKIKKTDALVVKDKKRKHTETGIHSDDDFEKSLLELDAPDLSNEVVTDNTLKIKEVAKSKEILSKKTESIKHEVDDDINSKLKSIDRKENHAEITIPDIIKIDDDSNCRKGKSKRDHGQLQNANSENNSQKSVDTSVHNDSIMLNKESRKTKRDLSEFLDDDDHYDKNRKKTKHDDSLNDSALSDQERHERKIMSAALYQKYLNRTGPKNLGAKEIPEGTPECLKDCSFLLTGVLDSFEREEIIAAITKYGGTVKSGISKKVTHVLAGEDAGPAKTAKAEALGIKIIDEDQFINMITELSKKTNNHKDKCKESNIKTENIKKETEKFNDKKKTPYKEKSKSNDKLDVLVKKEKSPKDTTPKNDEKSPKLSIKKEKSPPLQKDDKDVQMRNNDNASQASNAAPLSLMWVDKYKPQSIKHIIGQQGEASNVKKLINWLTNWYVNRKNMPKVKRNPWAKNDDGASYKAALLSGPPGVGKTTTVSLVCKELGFDMVEFNASDTRSKNLIKEQISELLSTNSLSGYARGQTGKLAVTKKHVLVMDEVDGMAGNEDRGGLQELISLIKTTSVPIVCMCNDRNSEKMRSLVNYCYDLRFSRPRVDQIKSAMLSMCYKESIKIPGDVLSQLISAAGQDIRQTIHLLSVWSADPALADHDRLQKEAHRVKKDIKMGPWEAIRKVFSAEDHKTMNINDRSDLFFTDYSLAPLFVHENYPQVVPHCPKHDILNRVSAAADSISLGDLVDSRIRSNQAWSLLPLQAMYSSVIPGQMLSGHIGGQIQFPGWLGKNSRANKMARLAQSIHAHTRLSTTGSKSSIFLDYAPQLRDAILNPLIKDKSQGISKSLQVLEDYHLLKDDLESLTELSLWPGQRNPSVLVDVKVKTALTKTYNKQASALPYAPIAVKKAKHHDTDENGMELEDEVEYDSDPENDALIKKKKTKANENPSTSKEKPQRSKGKKK
ncbi:unnamed protein product [Leptosia nina]|uniref:Replication factor C subunit 1 n=1 Tax=Leptosia nina TaxID=320188 RepID=A0AAV1JIH1_9NEOP